MSPVEEMLPPIAENSSLADKVKGLQGTVAQLQRQMQAMHEDHAATRAQLRELTRQQVRGEEEDWRRGRAYWCRPCKGQVDNRRDSRFGEEGEGSGHERDKHRGPSNRRDSRFGEEGEGGACHARGK